MVLLILLGLVEMRVSTESWPRHLGLLKKKNQNYNDVYQRVKQIGAWLDVILRIQMYLLIVLYQN